MTQFSLFGAEAVAPRLDDLDGLLLAGAQWVRSAGTARLSVVVADRWRAEALTRAFAALGVDGSDAVVPAAAGFGVRTGFVTGLVPSAARWTRGANQGVPSDCTLGAGGLRLWAIAAGRRDDVGYLLATPPPDEPLHRVAGAALSRLAGHVRSAAAPARRTARRGSGRRRRRLAERDRPAPGAVITR